MISLSDVKKFFLSLPQEEWVAVLSIFDENSGSVMKFIRTASPSSLKSEFEIKKVSTEQAGIKSWGLMDLIARLGELDGNIALDVQELSTQKWIGLCVSEKSKMEIIGCAFVENRKSGMRTPPNWDGSLEELNKFNGPDQTKKI
ncbi:hypothetical protein ACSFBF_30990 [Variovorax sp. ZT5P49]|uniref:hypothetical protein n=1 Tax=Variovorax sp. ZT5P49 TaxID=3443733 RepID=UPI003F4601FC